MKKDKGQHYRYIYKGIKLDPARIAIIYEATHPMQMAILKKTLKAGDRGQKTQIEDIEDIITAAERWIEMLKEDDYCFEGHEL